jgi:hypothetical protein
MCRFRSDGDGGAGRQLLEAALEFFADFAKQVELFNSGAGNTVVMFAIGQALQGHVNEKARTIFNTGYEFDSWIGPAKQAIAFFEAQIQHRKLRCVHGLLLAFISML